MIACLRNLRDPARDLLVPTAAAFVTALMACASPEAATWDGAARDSSGIRIVENGGRPLWRSGQEWSVAVGTSMPDGPGSEDDLGIVGSIAVDSKGNVYALDLLAWEIVAFAPDGRYLRTIGEAGTGPGQFGRFVTTVLAGTGDSLFVPDWGQARISVFAPDGSFARQIGVPPEPQAQSWSLADDGAFLFRGITIGRDAEGRYTTWDGLMRAGSALDATDTLIVFAYPRTDLGGPERSLVPLIIDVPFWTRLDDGRIAWSSLDREEVLVHDRDGKLSSIVRLSTWTRRRLTDDDRRVLEQKIRDRFQQLVGNPAIVDNLELSWEETLPAITDIRSGPDGSLWVRRMGDVSAIEPIGINTNDHSWALGGTTWDVFDRELRYLGSIALPDRFRVMRIEGTRIWGVRKDENDVETLQRFDVIAR